MTIMLEYTCTDTHKGERDGKKVRVEQFGRCYCCCCCCCCIWWCFHGFPRSLTMCYN